MSLWFVAGRDGARRFWDKGGGVDLNSLTLGAFLVKVALLKKLLKKDWKMKKVEFLTQGVCARKITFELNEGKIYNLSFEGGCAGNLQAISKLVDGKDAKEVANLLRHNDCRGKGTSCADQLAIAIEEALEI